VNEESRLTIVCVGLTGAGKSTTCNTLAGRQYSLVAEGFVSGTTEPLHCDVICNKIPLRIVDTVGFLSNKGKEDESQWWFMPGESEEKQEQFEKLTYTSIFGIDVFLFTCRYDRFTDQSYRHFEVFLDLVGPEALEHTILVFTYVTDAKLQEALMRDDLPEKLQEIISKVRHVVGVENKLASKKAAKDLLQAVKEVVEANKGRRYLSDALCSARSRRDDLKQRIEVLQDQRTRSDLLDQCGMIANGKRTCAEVLRSIEAAEERQALARRCPSCWEWLSHTPHKK